MGKRKSKPLLAVQGIVHLTESFVQPSQESGLLTTVGGGTECPGLILAPNYGYAIAASTLAKKAEEEEAAATAAAESNKNEAEGEEEKSDEDERENIENETPAVTESEESSNDLSDLSVAELVRHIGGAKDKPFTRRDVVEDRPESELPQKPIEEDDAETAEFYQSLGIVRPTANKAVIPPDSNSENSNQANTNDTKEVTEPEKSVPESVADFYKSYQTEYVYSVQSDPYGTQPLEFSLPTSAYFPQESEVENNYSILEVARRAQKAKRDYEARKAALEKSKKNKDTKDEDEDAYDPLPMEIVPTNNTRGPNARPEETTLTTYWEYVQENPHDFNRWAFLISYVESTASLNEIRKVYSAFLPLFPYCFGYWKRYSDIEKGHNYLQRALTILQRGLEFIPLSVDLWMSFLTLYAEVNAHNKDFQDILREQYELALNSCGMEFRSDALWDSYIQWETNLEKLKNSFVLYKRLLLVPTRLYNRHWDNCKLLIREHHPRDFLAYDDYEHIRRKGCKELGFRYKPEPEIEPGEIRKTKKPEDKLMDYVKEKVLDKLSRIQLRTAVETDKRWDFEDKIKRPYYHVKPLDKAQLWNWDQYLNFEINEGNHDRIVLLFERCLIACANYERFWCKYARYLEKYYRAHPEHNSSAHLQTSVVNVEIVSKKAAEEEEEIVTSVESILSSIVDEIVEAENQEIKDIEYVMATILNQLDDSTLLQQPVQVNPSSPPCNSHSSSDEAVQSLIGTSEEETTELPLNSANEKESCSGFAALIRIPEFPTSKYPWHEIVRGIYKRASLIHVPRRPTIRLQWAAFEEEIGNVTQARELIAYVFEWHPSHLEAKLQLLDLERRNNSNEAVVEVYENLLKETKKKEVISLLSLKYARFLFKELGAPDKALLVLRNAVRKDNSNHLLYSLVFEICYYKYPTDKKGVYAALELIARADKLTPEQKLHFARRRAYFYQDHSDLVRYRNALDDLYEVEATVQKKKDDERKWREFEARVAAEKAEEEKKSLQPFPVPTTTSQKKPPQQSLAIQFERLNGERDIEFEIIDSPPSTDVGPSLPYAAVPPVDEFLDPNYGYGGRHPDAKLAEYMGHKQYEQIEAKGLPASVKDTPEDLELLRERKRKNPLYIVPPRGSFYINSDADVPGETKRVRLEAPVLLSQLITPNSAPVVNVPDWFVKEGGELCISETVHGFSILRYWPHFLSEDGNKKMFQSLRKSVKWHQKQILTSYGTWRYIPRLVSWLGPCEYSHTGMVMKRCEDWTPEILDLLHRLIQLANYEFNSCSLNLYRTGHDSNAWHADIHPALGSNPPIASISLGALRTFELKRKGQNSTNFLRFPLFPGSLLIMEGATQADWLHQVPKEPATKAERLNLTFRIMHALEDEDPEDKKDKKSTEDDSKKDDGGDNEEKSKSNSADENKKGDKSSSSSKSKDEIDPLLLATYPEKDKSTKDKSKDTKPWEMQTKIRFRN